MAGEGGSGKTAFSANASYENLIKRFESLSSIGNGHETLFTRPHSGIQGRTATGQSNLPIFPFHYPTKKQGAGIVPAPCRAYGYNLGMMKLCSPCSASVTVPAGKKMTGFPFSSTLNFVCSSMLT